MSLDGQDSMSAAAPSVVDLNEQRLLSALQRALAVSFRAQQVMAPWKQEGRASLAGLDEFCKSKFERERPAKV